MMAVRKNWRGMAAAAALGWLLAACASESGEWVRSGASEDQMRRDTAACNRQAEEILAREMRIDSNAAADDVMPHESRSVEGTFAVLDARDVRRRAFDSCMRGRGYLRSSK